ncbi:hypothetical protein SAMN02949497_3700 [Methylomagnum ishizawai]|uniref:Uncharacterized protein n=1 Tax=Methylomagnum ishizawai TaxID=1760988 RepID=A0A1Y6D145_9GAMM|nr:hypothetical protein [Methylomagnum ishizawai]SMF96306.1 hypothetical protein SAMN02949497_3700 [Methylomagnum ishizawai]
MENGIAETRDGFLHKVGQLFMDIEVWSRAAQIDPVRSGIAITEEACGTYPAEKIVLRTPQGGVIAEIVPVGAWVLGAEGRVDIKGAYDSASIVYLGQGGPKAVITKSDGQHESTRTVYFYKGIDEAGWYWIDGRLSKGYRFDQELFFDLLSEVADYERQ